VISGTPAIGSSLFIQTPATWSATPTGEAYLWQIASSSGGSFTAAPASNTGTSYVIPSSAGSFVRLQQTASFSTGSPVVAYSETLGPIYVPLTLSNMTAVAAGSTVTVTVDCSQDIENVTFQQGSAATTNVTPSGGVATLAYTGLVAGSYTFSCVGYQTPPGDGGPASTTATATATVTVAPSTGAATPNGPPGSWTLIFDDEFPGTSLDTTKWTIITTTTINNVTPSAANVSVSGGQLALTLASSTSGAAIVTGGNERGVTAPNGVMLAVGDYMEASINLPGYVSQYGANNQIPYNWPAFWSSTDSTSASHEWPVDGEIDVVEGLNSFSTNYHWGPGGSASAQSAGSGQILGNWANSFHTYGTLRGASTITIYWDGVAVHTFTPQDAGGPQAILLNVGSGEGELVTGSASQVLVDYVRVWTPGSSGATATAPTLSTPTITGSPVEGATLTANIGTVTGTPTPKVTYQWMRG
jgi:hypothetical protein